MTFRTPGRPTVLDRVMSLMGVPAATRHDRAIQSADAAIRVSIEANTRAEELTDAIRQLEFSMDKKR